MIEPKISLKVLLLQIGVVVAGFYIFLIVHHYNQSKKTIINDMPFFQTTIFRATVDHGWLTLNDTISVNGVLYPINSDYMHTRLMDLRMPYMMIKDNDSIIKVYFGGDTLRYEIE